MPIEPGGRDRLRLVTDVLRSFADATTDYARLLQAIAQGVSRILELPCSIRLLTLDGDKLETAAFHHPSNDVEAQTFSKALIPITPEVRAALDAARAYVDHVHTAATIEAAHGPGAAARVRLREVLVAPLVARGRALGCLFVPRSGHDDDDETFTPEDRDLADALAHHAALAIANARLMTSIETVERAREHERSIIDTVSAPLLLVDRDAQIAGANRAFLQTFGVDAKEAIGQTLFAVARGAFSIPEMRELFTELPPSGPGIDGVEVDIPTATGLRTFLVRTRKTFRPGNGSQTTLITLVDLTDRKAAERGARRRALLASAMNEPLVGTDPSFKVVEWNAAAERLFGWTAAEVIGRPIEQVFEVDQGSRREESRRQLRRGESVRAQTRIKRRDGKWLDLEYSTMPLVDRDVATGFVTVMLDMTERNHLEAELRARVDELTIVNQELESFSYSVSHDLRAPVRAIDGFSEILEEEHATVLDEEGRRLLGLVRKNAKRMGLLIDDILALARFARQPLALETVDMDALARSTLDEAIRAEPGRKITVRIAPLPPIWGDESLLRQVWLNLFANAVKYTRGRHEAVIETTAEETSGEVVYTVKDNGAGFDMRHADRLFGVFERLHAMKDFEGTGIGLALVARIAKRHSGRVWGTGEVDKGATFHFALPRET